MPILENQRHEQFAQLVANGKSALDAYELAGYARNRACASRLQTNANIKARIQELQAVAADKHEITRDLITQYLKEDRELAYRVGQPAAAKSASESLGRLHGLYVEKSESTRTNYFVRMPEPIDDIEEWQKRYSPKHQAMQ